MIDNPAADLVALKKTCTELQRELAYSAVDKDAVARLAEDVFYLGERLADWANKK